jgi:Leucine-rich repeat (LRR) protein
LPGWLTELDQLLELDVTHNGIEMVPEVIGYLTGLNVLDLSSSTASPGWSCPATG